MGGNSEGESDDGGVFNIDQEENLGEEPTPLGEDIFALATASFVRDYVFLKTGSAAYHIRVSRMVFTFLLVLGCFSMQYFLLSAVYHLLCEAAVNAIRQDYSHYQHTMYGDHVHKNQNGFWRGDGEQFLNVSAFETLTDSEKHNVCQIPLAHPGYTGMILFIWSLTCCADLRNAVEGLTKLIMTVPTVDDMQLVLRNVEGGSGALVAGLTMPMKFFIAFFIFLPRILTIFLLAFLGCRWLLATNSLSDLLLNGLALEFMLMLKELLYVTLASKRNKFITENTFLPEDHHEYTMLDTLGAAGWAVLAGGWVYSYLYHLQMVIPGYNWDVKEVCATWAGAVST